MSKKLATSLITLALSLASVKATVPVYGQCGGQNYSGETGKYPSYHIQTAKFISLFLEACASGSVCTYSNPYYSQCIPGAATSTTTPVRINLCNVATTSIATVVIIPPK